MGDEYRVILRPKGGGASGRFLPDGALDSVRERRSPGPGAERFRHRFRWQFPKYLHIVCTSEKRGQPRVAIDPHADVFGPPSRRTVSGLSLQGSLQSTVVTSVSITVSTGATVWACRFPSGAPTISGPPSTIVSTPGFFSCSRRSLSGPPSQQIATVSQNGHQQRPQLDAIVLFGTNKDAVGRDPAMTVPGLGGGCSIQLSYTRVSVQLSV